MSYGIGDALTRTVRDFGINVANWRHLKGQSGVDRETHGRVTAFLDENTQAFGLCRLHFSGVFAAIRCRRFGSAANERNARCEVTELVGAILLIILYGSHWCHGQQGHYHAKYYELLVACHFSLVVTHLCPLSLSFGLFCCWVCEELGNLGIYKLPALVICLNCHYSLLYLLVVCDTRRWGSW